MCGICGILYLDKGRLVDENILTQMRDVLSHRGPDDMGLYISGKGKEQREGNGLAVGLGHRRLSIVDLSTGHQPMSNEDGSVWIVCNGEIYNHNELRQELVAKGHRFQTNSDTESIIHLYEDLGVECVPRLRGMFAFALWDDRKKNLLIARDRMGIKPLYYTLFENTLIFASEIKSILKYPDVKPEMNIKGLDLYLSLRYVPGPYTMFKNVEKLLPGHILIAGIDGIKQKKYWDLDFCPTEEKSDEAFMEEFESLLSSSINMRLMSDVPLGVFLSGGIDSSAIVALMSKMVDKPIKTFSVGYDDSPEVNEFQYANYIAERYGTEHHEFVLSPEKFGDFIPKLVWYLDEPIADSAAIPLYFITKLAKEHVTVALSGEGADEILAGYSIYVKMLQIEKLRNIIPPFTLSIFLAIMKKVLLWQNARKYIALTNLPLENRYMGVSSIFNDVLKKQLTNGSYLNGSDHTSTYKFLGNYYSETNDCDIMSRMMHLDSKVWLPDDLLMKADKMTMANSMELRVPFLDHKLVEFAASIPYRLKLKSGKTKFLLKEILVKYLPRSFVYRPKKGFPVPLRKWLKEELYSLSREVILSNRSACSTYLNKVYIEKMLYEHKSGRANYSEEIWSLLVFEYWHSIFINSKIV